MKLVQEYPTTLAVDISCLSKRTKIKPEIREDVPVSAT